ncbi:encapsulin-associated ferritin-like protein [Acetobacterium carbinolicum]|jgi:ferritin-like protein|uniref:encapsulin-associated ferritin-like protein n=1 Tax=Acetobacterium carbinolicum TaxID=52690 RepID=UPI0039BFF6DE
MAQYHEPIELLDEKTMNITRAINSLKEELEAVDWYNQRVAATSDPELKGIMAHNRDEEIEHACMAIEWLRRNMDKWDEELRTYLFVDGSILEAEESEAAPESVNISGIHIGDLKK